MTKILPFQETTDPAAVPDNIVVYAKDVAGITQLFGRASDGTITQLTPGIFPGGLTAGSILFANALGQISQDNPNLFFDNTNKRVGIGTNAPTKVLDIRGNLTADGLASITNTSLSGYSDLLFNDNLVTLRGAVGYGNTGVAIAHLAQRLFFYNDINIGAGRVQPLVFAGPTKVLTYWDFVNNRVQVAGGGVAATAPGDYFEVVHDDAVSRMGITVRNTTSGSARNAGYQISNPAGVAVLQMYFTAGDGYNRLVQPNAISDRPLLLITQNTDPSSLVSSMLIGTQAPGSAGYSAIGFGFSSPVLTRGSAGYGMAAVPIVHLRDQMFLYAPGHDWIVANTTVETHRFGNTAGSVFHAMNNGAAAANSAPGTGRIRYNNTTKTWQVSMDTAVYVNLATGVGMAIGNTIGNGPTTGSLLFVGAAGVLEQDNANLFWSNANDRLGIGTNTPIVTLDVSIASAGGILQQLCNEDDSGYSALMVSDDGAVMQGLLGYGNGTVPLAHLQNRNFWMVAADGAGLPLIEFANPTDRTHSFGTETDNVYVQIFNGEDASVGAADSARLIYNKTAGTLQVSFNGDPFVTIQTA